jgi:LPS-assembly protein
LFRPYAGAAALSVLLTAAASQPLHGAEPKPTPAGSTAAQALRPLPALPLCPDTAFALAQSASAPTRRAEPTGNEPIDISSDDASFAIGGDAQVAGKVVVRQGERRITADKVTVDAADNGLSINGNVSFEDPDIRVRSATGEYRGGNAEFRAAEFELLNQPARGSAGRLSLTKAGVLTLGDVAYTTCPPGDTDWQITADSVTLDAARQSGVARGARVEFMGLPIVKLPWISFPVGSTRKTGFLFPSVGNSSRGGIQLTVPYYLNLAENYDLTLEPTLYSRRGLDLYSELRFLGGSSRGQLDVNLLPRDNITGSGRSRLRLREVTELPGNWRLRINAENVSDAAYFEDFAQGADNTSIAFLPRTLQLRYRDDALDLGVLVRNFQTIDTGLDAIERPYTELPRLHANGWWTRGGALPLEFGFASELVGFRRSVGVTGWRADAEPRAQLRYEGPGYFLRPSVALRGTAYELDDRAPGEPESLTRMLPIASLDAGLLFERATGSNGRRRMTLEPRLMYLYTPYRDQSRIPVFDTNVPDLTWVQLFRTNRYVGADRVGDANQLSTGVTTRLFAADTGARYLSATVGRTFYFEDPRVVLPGESPARQLSADYIAQLEVKALKNWNVDLGVQWNPTENRPERSEIRVQYRPEGNQLVNLGYRFQRQRLEQGDVSVAWPVNRQWNLYGRMLYSLRDSNVVEQFAGLQYDSCCWSARAVVRNFVTRRNGERDTGYYLQLELKGLSNVGLAADAFLERSIRGYSPANER